jgi:hypothetical protein
MLRLKQHTATQLQAFKEAVAPLSEPRLTGIACDGCGAELLDVPHEPAMFQMGNPPRREVFCLECPCKGWRVLWSVL